MNSEDTKGAFNPRIIPLLVMANEVLALYRRWLRVVRKFPFSDVRPKLRFNVREVFEIYKTENDSAVIAESIAHAKEDAETFEMICNMPLQFQHDIYQPFSTTLQRSNMSKNQFMQHDAHNEEHNEQQDSHNAVAESNF